MGEEGRRGLVRIEGEKYEMEQVVDGEIKGEHPHITLSEASFKMLIVVYHT